MQARARIRLTKQQFSWNTRRDRGYGKDRGGAVAPEPTQWLDCPLKGDFPFRGSKTFLRLDGILNPVVVDTNQDAVDTQINTNLILAAEVFHGSTAVERMPKRCSRTE